LHKIADKASSQKSSVIFFSLNIHKLYQVLKVMQLGQGVDNFYLDFREKICYILTMNKSFDAIININPALMFRQSSLVWDFCV